MVMLVAAISAGFGVALTIYAALCHSDLPLIPLANVVGSAFLMAAPLRRDCRLNSPYLIFNVRKEMMGTTSVSAFICCA